MKIEVVIFILFTGLMTFGSVVTGSNFFQSDYYYMKMNDTMAFQSHCGSSIGFIDFFNGEWNCSGRNNTWGMGIIVMPFTFMISFTLFTYGGWCYYLYDLNQQKKALHNSDSESKK